LRFHLMVSRPDTASAAGGRCQLASAARRGTWNKRGPNIIKISGVGRQATPSPEPRRACWSLAISTTSLGWCGVTASGRRHRRPRVPARRIHAGARCPGGTAGWECWRRPGRRSGRSPGSSARGRYPPGARNSRG